MITFDPYAYKAWQERARLKRESLVTSLGDEMGAQKLKSIGAASRRDYSQQLRDEAPEGKFRTIEKVKKKSQYQAPILKKKVKFSGMMSQYAALGHIKKF